MLSLSVEHPGGRKRLNRILRSLKMLFKIEIYLSAGDMLESQVKFDETFKKIFDHTMSRCSL